MFAVDVSTFRFQVMYSISILCSDALSMTDGTELYSLSPMAVTLQWSVTSRGLLHSGSSSTDSIFKHPNYLCLYIMCRNYNLIDIQYENSKESKVGDWSYRNILSWIENSPHGGSYNHELFRLTFSLFSYDLIWGI